MNNTPLISVICTAYNQEAYIRDALEGFVMQKTNFAFEIIVHDDASTDNTAFIIREYEEKYSGLFHNIYQTENQYSKGNGDVGRVVFSAANGRYIALCEGDDYWTDPLKLQKQVDFLEGNEDCSLCFHASKHVDTRNLDNFYIHRPKHIPKNNKFEMKNAILGGGGLITTNSMVFHRDYISERPEWMDKAPVGDLPLMLILASKGMIGYIDDVMSVYRQMSSSTSWSATMQNRNLAKEHHYAILRMWTEFDRWSNSKYHKYVVQKKIINKGNYYKGYIRNIIKRIITK